MDSFLEVFGDWTIGHAAAYIVAGAFLYGVYRKIAQYFKKKAIDDFDKDKRVQEVIDQASHYPEWRQQSIDMQRQLTAAIEGMQSKLGEVISRIESMEERNQKRERNQLRDRILQQYRYFTNKAKNPMQAWSEMEAEAFWKIYGDYEERGGNGFIHTDVQPAMRALEVIPMMEVEKVTELMHSRR